MNVISNLSIIAIVMPILVAVSVLTIIVIAIVVYGKTKKAQSLSIVSFEALAQKLIADNEAIQAELATIKEDVASINKMMKEIE